MGWHAARTSLPLLPPRSSGAPARRPTARWRRASGVAAAPRSRATGAPAARVRRALAGARACGAIQTRVGTWAPRQEAPALYLEQASHLGKYKGKFSKVCTQSARSVPAQQHGSWRELKVSAARPTGRYIHFRDCERPQPTSGTEGVKSCEPSRLPAGCTAARRRSCTAGWAAWACDPSSARSPRASAYPRRSTVRRLRARPEWLPPRSARVTPPHLQVSRGMRRSSATRRRRASWRRRNNGSSSRLRRASATPLRMAGHLQMSPPPRPRPPSPCMICTRARRSWRRRPPVTAGCRASTTAMRRGAARSKTARPAATRHSLGATVARP